MIDREDASDDDADQKPSSVPLPPVAGSTYRRQERPTNQLPRVAHAIGRTGLIWWLWDAGVGVAALILGIRLSPYPTAAMETQNPLGLAVLYGLLLVVAGFVTGLHDRVSVRRGWHAVFPALLAAGLALTCVLWLNYLLSYDLVGRWIFVIAGAFGFAGTALPRVIFGKITQQWQMRTLVIGGTETPRTLQEMMEDNPSVRIVEIIPGEAPPAPGSPSLRERCVKQPVDVIAIDARAHSTYENQSLRCLSLGIRVVDLVTFLEENLGKVPVECIIGPRWMIQADLRQGGIHGLSKRVLDLAFAIVGLAITFPFWLLIALAIKATSPGPVFYTQTRVGRHGQPFTLFKFRTMRRDAEDGTGPVWAQQQDMRVTRVGRFLRRTRLDEVPQFLNVLRGSMSFVGPRPERPELTETLATEIPHFALRHMVKPGITGWAQIHFGYGATVADATEKLRYDLYYVKHHSVLLDLLIVVRTLGTIMKGAR